MDSPTSVSRFTDIDIYDEKRKLIDKNCSYLLIENNLIQYVWTYNKPSDEFTYLSHVEGLQCFIQTIKALLDSNKQSYIDIAKHVIDNENVDFKDVPDICKESNLKVPDEWLKHIKHLI